MASSTMTRIGSLVSYQIDIARHSASRAVGCLWPRIITKRGPLIEPPVAIGFAAREDRRRRADDPSGRAATGRVRSR
jgi:hypothetical protein